MELRHILGNTYAAMGVGATMGLYRLNDRDVVLIDTGIRQKDRADLDAMIEENGFAVRGIFASHAHYDHCGSTAYLRRRWNAQTAAQIIEAGIAATAESYRANYSFATYEECRTYFAQEFFPTDVLIGTEDVGVSFCGADFGILQLPGHTAGQIGIVTPDNVAYVADCVIGPSALAGSRLLTSMDIATDLKSKASLRELSCKAYILAHHDVTEDIRPIVDMNIAAVHRMTGEILDTLEDGMTSDQWRIAYAGAMGFRTANAFKLGVIRRNFSSFVVYLEERGQIGVEWHACTKHYFHR